MPRKKKPGSRGDSPEKNLPMNNSAAQYGLAGGPGPGSGKWMEKGGVHSNQQSTLQSVQEMFHGQVDHDVIYMVLHECDWKVNDAVEKLMVIASGGEKQQQIPEQAYVMHSENKGLEGYAIPAQRGASEPMDIQPRQGVVDDRGLAMLSPKTPSLVNSNFPDLYNSAYSQESNMQYALQAIDSFANNPATTMYPAALQRQSSYDPNLFDVNSPQSHNSFSSYNPDSSTNLANTQQQHNQGMQNVAPGMQNVAQPNNQMYIGLNVVDQQRTSPNPQQLFTKPGDLVSQLSPSANIFVPSPPPPVTSSMYGPIPQNHGNQFMHPPPNVSTPSVSQQQQQQAWAAYDNSEQGAQDMVPNLIPSQSKYYQMPVNKAQAAQQSFVKRGHRKKTLSLNPEEREALENLIEDVIIGGVDDGVMDSDESVSSESEEDPKKSSALNKENNKQNAQSPQQLKQNSGQNKAKEPKDAASNLNKNMPKGGKGAKGDKNDKAADGQQKVYPPQLKVAVKHMKNLPPRFLRKLQVPPKDGDSSSKSDSSDAESAKYKAAEVKENKRIEQQHHQQQQMNRNREDFKEKERRTKEVHKLEMKMKIRGMLGEGLDHYIDETQDDKKGKKSSILPVAEVDECEQHSPQQQPSNDPGQSILQLIQSPSAKSPNHGVPQAQQIVGSMPNSQFLPPNHAPPPLVSAAGNNSNKSNYLIQQNVMNCEDLERKLLQCSVSDTQPSVSRSLQNTAPLQIPHQAIDPGGGAFQKISNTNSYRINNLHEQFVTSSHAGPAYFDPKSHLSLDAPEFVPRVFTPVSGTKPHEQQIPQHLQNAGQLPAGFPPQLQQQQLNSSVYQPHIGRSSPQVVTASSNHSHLTQQEQLNTMARGSPAPPPAFIMPKMPPPPQPQLGLNAPPPSVPPPGVIPYQQYAAPPSGVNTAPPTYRPQFPGFPPPPTGGSGAPGSGAPTQQFPAAAAAQFAGHFLVPAWSGGKKLPDLSSNSQQQRSPFMVQPQKQVSGSMGLRSSAAATALLYATARPSSAPNSRINPGMSPKFTHKGFYGIDHKQTKEKIQALIKTGRKVMVILRGLPGSGKTTLAKELQNNGIILSSDDFFLKNGKYEHDYNKLGEAHEWNQKRAKESLEQGKTPVIIDNTNTQFWEMKPYASMALKNEYLIELLEPDTPWKFRPKELHQKNVHTVPLDRIQAMLDRYDNTVTVERLLGQPPQIIHAPLDHMDHLKLFLELQQQQMQPVKKPARKRKRRRRRKNKHKDDDMKNEDSEKADDEGSSDEEAPPPVVDTNKLSSPSGNNGQTLDSDADEQKDKFSDKSEIEKPKININTTISSVTKNVNNGTIVNANVPAKITPTKINATVSKMNDSATLKNPTPRVENSKTASNILNVETIEEESECSSLTSPEVQDTQSSPALNDSTNKITENCLLVNDSNRHIGKDSPKDSECNVSETCVSTNLGNREMPSVDETKPTIKEGENGESANLKSDANGKSVIDSLVGELVCQIVSEAIEQVTVGSQKQTDIASVKTSPEDGSQIPPSLTDSGVEVDMKPTKTENGEQLTKLQKEIQDVIKEAIFDSIVNNQVEEAVKFAENLPGSIESEICADKNGSKTEQNISDRTVESSGQSSNSQSSASLEEKYWSPVHVADPYAVGGQSEENQTEDESAKLNIDENGVTESVELCVDVKPLQQRQPKIRNKQKSTEDVWTDLDDDKTKTDQIIEGEQIIVDGRMSEGVSDASVETTSHDFALIQRCNHGDEYTLLDHFRGVFACDAAKFVPAQRVVDNDERTIPFAYNLDKGTSTSDLEPETGIDNLEFLRSCFPEVSDADLTEILNNCRNDVEWAVNILLDAGYEYNEPCNNNNDEPFPPLEPVSSANAAPQNSGSSVDVPTSVRDETVEFISALNANDNLDIYTNSQHENTSISNAQDPVVKPKDRQEIVKSKDRKPLVGYGSDSDSEQSESGDDNTPANSDAGELTADGRSPLHLQPRSPRPLILQCYDKLFTTGQITDVNTSDFNENFARSSITRLQSIEESKHLKHDNQPQTDNQLSGSLVSDVYDELATQHVPVHAHSLPKRGSLDQIADNYLSSSDEEDGGAQFKLNLDHKFVQQLISVFGPAGQHTSAESLTCEDLEVLLTRRAASHIHRSLVSTLQSKVQPKVHHKKQDELIRADEEFARKLQAMENQFDNMHVLPRKQGESSSSRSSRSPSPRKRPAVVGICNDQSGIRIGDKLAVQVYDKKSDVEQPASLKDIMDEEQAMERSRKDMDAQNSEDLSMRLSRKKLYEEYPGIDKPVIDDIFQACDYSYQSARKVITETLGSTGPAKTVMTPQAEAEYEARLIEQAKQASLQEAQKRQPTIVEVQEYQSTSQPQYHDLRGEAALHFKLRNECFQKAQEAYKRGMKPVASFYSQQGHLHSEKLREANFRAAENIIKHRNTDTVDNNTIDLHGLHVDEALHVLKEIIVTRELDILNDPQLKEKFNKKRMYLYIVTGRGKHSHRGVAKIKPAVIDFLKKNNYKYLEHQPGLLRILLHYK